MGIYVIECKDAKAVKIGFFKGSNIQSALQRVVELQTGNPFGLNLVNIFEGDRYVEHKIHNRLRHLRIRGEWFELVDEVLSTVIEITSKPYSNEHKIWPDRVCSGCGGPLPITRSTFCSNKCRTWVAPKLGTTEI
jgi:hypothetical protein